MLKSISLQLESEEKQLLLEKSVAQQIHSNFKRNLAALQKTIPSLLDIAINAETEEFSIFINKNGHLNVTSMLTGQALYKLDPQTEARKEVQAFIDQAQFVSIQKLACSAIEEALPINVDVIFVFGLGLGYHICELLENCRVKLLVIYEPEIDFLTCSLYAADWERLLVLANSQNTQISFQIGNAATSVIEDMSELSTLLPESKKIYLYRHFCHPVMDEVYNFLLANSGKPEQLFKNGTQFLGFKNPDDYVDLRKNMIPASSDFLENSDLYLSNLATFKRLYPEIYEELHSYKPKSWRLQYDGNGKPNLWHQQRKVFFYDDIDTDSESIIESYLKAPFKDDVIIGVEKSEKFKSFVHYKYIEKLQDIFNQFKSEKHALPGKVESIIVFGIALGKHLDVLLTKRDIEKLYVFEPNLDFFHASLFVTDWAALLLKAEKENKRIYFNIGGDGKEYFNDLMGQFYQVGAYSIANTYLLPSYHTPQLAKSISSLKKQLKIVLAIGEYFDHSRYGIAHTFLSLKNNNLFMKYELKQLEHHKKTQNIPVFIVGNGPSLDGLAEYLKIYKDQAILVSCGTAISSLHKLGIRPHFHAEIEQSRATYDWITQVNDFAYLKSINLITVNGVHPDTAALFTKTYIAFKDGESSTLIFRSALEALGYSFSSLSYAYPTVSNLAMNFMVKLGFKAIYLFGVDLGYADVSKHHSQHSAYFNQQGKEVYDYKAFHGSGFPVKGNFRDFVFTKPEFDVSRQILERVIKHASGVEFYNCSDGAYIEGTRPLKPENILLLDSNSSLEGLVSSYFNEAFYSTDMSKLASDILDSFDLELFESSVRKWQEITKTNVYTLEDAKVCINKQWEFLKRSTLDKNNLLFCLLYGSSNYFLSLLTKLLPNSDESNADFERFNLVLSYWNNYLEDALEDFISEPIKADKVTASYLPKLMP